MNGMLTAIPSAQDRASMLCPVPIMSPLIEYGACDMMNSIPPIPSRATEMDLRKYGIASHGYFFLLKHLLNFGNSQVQIM